MSEPATSPSAAPAWKGGAQPFASFVIPTFNAKQWIGACLDSVVAAAERYRNAEIIVVDNGSTDGTYEEIATRYAGRVRLMREPGATISRLRNLGATAASGELLAFIDSDCLICPGALEKAVAVLDRTQAAATGSMYDLPLTPHWIERTWDELHRRHSDGWVNYLNSGNLFMRRSAFEQVGGFDEKLKTGEDAEIGQRLRRNGLRIYEAHEVSAVHLGNPKSLRRFFRKQAWHALGMFGTAKHGIDKPVVMTVTHGLLLAAALAIGIAAPLPWWLRLLLAVALIDLVPVVTVAFRALRGGSLRHPLQALLLYHVYFAARLTALLRIGLRRA